MGVAEARPVRGALGLANAGGSPPAWTGRRSGQRRLEEVGRCERAGLAGGECSRARSRRPSGPAAWRAREAGRLGALGAPAPGPGVYGHTTLNAPDLV